MKMSVIWSFLCLQLIFGSCAAQAPNAPNITEVISRNSTSFTVSWTLTGPDNNYIITWTNLRTAMMDNVTIPANSNDSYTVTGLNGIDNYNVTVAANNSEGKAMSDSYTVYDPPYLAPIFTQFPLMGITSESFVVTWDEVMDLFSINYTVRWYRGDSLIGMASVDGLLYNITGLTADTHYSVTVTAVSTCCGEGPPSFNIPIMTNYEPSILPTPANDTAVIITTTTSTTTTTTTTSTNTITVSNSTPGGDSGAYQASLSNGVIVTTVCVVALFVTLIAA